MFSVQEIRDRKSKRILNLLAANEFPYPFLVTFYQARVVMGFL